MCECKCILRFTLTVFNMIFVLAGLLLLAFGIVGLVNPGSLMTIFNNIPGINQIPAMFNLTGAITGCAVFMIVLGSIVAVIGMFGFFGACCQVQWMLISYVVVLVIIILVEIALIIFAAVFPNNLKTQVQTTMSLSLKNNFRNEITGTAGGSFVLPTSPAELAWAGLQIETQCCGAYNYSDYASLTSWNNSYPFAGVAAAKVPISCCTMNPGVDITVKFDNTSFVNLNKCLTGVSNINQPNCYDAVNKLIQQYGNIAIGITAAIIGLEIILMVLAVMLCRIVRQEQKGG